LIAGGPQESEINVNSRYTIESVELSGTPERDISTSLRKDISRLIGEKLSTPSLDDLARRIRRELHVRAVRHHVLRGDAPEHVKVVFEVKGRPRNFEVSIPKFLYHAKQGWSAAAEGTVQVDQHRFTAGVVSDGDELSERYAGVNGRYENRRLGTDKLRFCFLAESYHEQWNRTTRTAAAEAYAPGVTSPIYRSRDNFEPTLTLALAGPLTVSVGAGFGRIEPEAPAARTEASNSVITAVRYHRQMEGSSSGRQELDAAYNLRAATAILASDYAFARHMISAHYAFSRGRHMAMDYAMAGLIGGRAPLYERFVLGTSSTLRGWNKFDLDPLGGDRMAHNTLEYRYRFFEVFYDTGAVWTRGQPAVARHSVGTGIRHDGFHLAVAFPVREGRVEPLFMLGMNY
jgi:hypothetical protein